MNIADVMRAVVAQADAIGLTPMAMAAYGAYIMGWYTYGTTPAGAD